MCVCVFVYTHVYIFIYGGEVFGVLGPTTERAFVGWLQMRVQNWCGGGVAQWGGLEQKCTILSVEDRVLSRVPAGWLSSHDCLPHGGCSTVCQLPCWTVFGTPCSLGRSSRDLPSPSRGVLACVRVTLCPRLSPLFS